MGVALNDGKGDTSGTLGGLRCLMAALTSSAEMGDIIIIIIIMYISWSWATCWPVPVSRIQKPLQRSAMIPSASWGVVFHYPG